MTSDLHVINLTVIIVGVHCTHGFNRTGYMICSYLVEEYGSSIEAAVDTFVAARQPGIYKEHYLRELFEYYKGDQTLVRVPDLPNWDAPDEPVVPTLTARPAGPAEQSHSFKRQRGDEDDDDADDDHPSKKQVKGLVGVDSVIGSVIGGERAFQVRQKCFFFLGLQSKQTKQNKTKTTTTTKKHAGPSANANHVWVPWKPEDIPWRSARFDGFGKL